MAGSAGAGGDLGCVSCVVMVLGQGVGGWICCVLDIGCYWASNRGTDGWRYGDEISVDWYIACGIYPITNSHSLLIGVALGWVWTLNSGDRFLGSVHPPSEEVHKEYLLCE